MSLVIRHIIPHSALPSSLSVHKCLQGLDVLVLVVSNPQAKFDRLLLRPLTLHILRPGSRPHDKRIRIAKGDVVVWWAPSSGVKTGNDEIGRHPPICAPTLVAQVAFREFLPGILKSGVIVSASINET
jgi:hypothetical protein